MKTLILNASVSKLHVLEKCCNCFVPTKRQREKHLKNTHNVEEFMTINLFSLIPLLNFLIVIVLIKSIRNIFS